MRNYLAAECYKVFRRKYLYIALAVCLALESLLLWGTWLTCSWGNTSITFYSTAIMVAMLLSFGMYATFLTGDVVFSEQYKHTTLKNEVSYGLPRTRIYLGKLTISILVALIACVVLVGFYLAGCWFLYPHDGMDAKALELVLYCLAGALPLWLAAQAVVIACYFQVRGSTMAAFTGIAILAVLPPVFEVFGLIFHPVFEMLRQVMPAVMMEQLRNAAFDWGYVGQCWLVGLVWFAAATALGLGLFRKKEIR